MLHPPGLGPDAAEQALEVLLLLRGAAVEELGIGGHGGDRGAEFVGGVGHEAAHARLRGPQPPLRGDAGGEGRLDAAEHDVERPGEPADLGALVLAGHPLPQVAGGDRLGHPLHVPQGTEAEVDEPQSTGQCDDHGAAGHGQLDEEEMVEGAPDVTERLGQDEDVAVGQRGGQDAERGPTGPGRGGVEVHDAGAVGGRGEAGDRGREGRQVGGAVHVGRAALAGHHHPGRRPHLDGGDLDGVGRWSDLASHRPTAARGWSATFERSVPGAPDQGPAVTETLLVEAVEGVELGVHAGVEEGLEGRVGDHVGHHQGHEGDDPDCGEQTAPEREPHVSAGSRRA